jgi:hypothetical protein
MRARLASYGIVPSLLLKQAALLALLPILPVSAQSAPQKKYMVSIGSPSGKVSSGAIWLYSHSWYGLKKIRLASIKDGAALVLLDSTKLKRELNPHPNTDGYVVALQAGEHLWYRTPDIRPDVLWSDISLAINSLGRADASSTGETQLILPPSAKRQITLLYTDGKPAVNASVTLSIYLSDDNHCAFHEGLPLGTFRTDNTGAIEVLALLVPLYLDGISYYKEVGSGPAGVAYSHNVGLKTGPEEKLVLKQHWELTDDESLSENAELRVLTRDGRPRNGVDVYGSWQTNTCGGGDRIGRTDSKGIAQIVVDPSFTGLELMVGGPYRAGDPELQENSRNLTSDELHGLFSQGRVTIRW